MTLISLSLYKFRGGFKNQIYKNNVYKQMIH